MGQYKVKEIHLTVQGEGYHTGREAVFVRFTGCNLWSGREEDRHKAICQFCDTDFWGTDGHLGGKYSAVELVDQIIELWPHDTSPFVVLTGGEPLLQLDDSLIDVCHEHDILLAVETNGTIAAPPSIDWLCMSPKAHTDIVQQSGDEIKIIWPQAGIDPADYTEWDFDHFYLQPMYGDFTEANTRACQDYIRTHKQWKLSRQMHKVWGVD